MKRKELSPPERDGLIAKSRGLKKRKDFLDAIDTLRHEGAEGQIKFDTDCSFICDASGIYIMRDLVNYVKSLEKKGALTIWLDTNMSGWRPWGENAAIVHIGKDFDDYVTRVREEYHSIQKKLELPKTKNIEPAKWIYITNPVWLVIKLAKFLWRHKIAFSIILAIVTYLGIDYSLAWRNFKWIINLIH